MKSSINIKHESYFWSLSQHFMCHVTQLDYFTDSQIIKCSIKNVLLLQYAGYKAVLWCWLKYLMKGLSIEQRLPTFTVIKLAVLLLKKIQFYSLTKNHGIFPQRILFLFSQLLFFQINLLSIDPSIYLPYYHFISSISRLEFFFLSILA